MIARSHIIRIGCLALIAALLPIAESNGQNGKDQIPQVQHQPEPEDKRESQPTTRSEMGTAHFDGRPALEMDEKISDFQTFGAKLIERGGPKSHVFALYNATVYQIREAPEPESKAKTAIGQMAFTKELRTEKILLAPLVERDLGEDVAVVRKFITERCFVNVTSKPKGAVISCRGLLSGKPTESSAYVESGPFEITVSTSGYKPQTRTLVLAADGFEKLNFVLEKQ